VSQHVLDLSEMLMCEIFQGSLKETFFIYLFFTTNKGAHTRLLDNTFKQLGITSHLNIYLYLHTKHVSFKYQLIM